MMLIAVNVFKHKGGRAMCFKKVLIPMAGLAVLAADRAEAAQTPDVVVVFTDDWGYGDLGAYGHLTDIKTPHLDLLAQKGVLFTDGYITSPQCGPSRAGLMTGRYNQRFGVDNLVDMPLPLNETTLADRLKKAGYKTGMVGKWHLEPIVVSHKWAKQHHPELIQGPHVRTPMEIQLPYFPQKRGFDEFFYGEINPYWANFSLDQTPLPKEGKWVQDPRFRVDVQMEAGLRFLQNNIPGKQPVFLYLAPYAPHVPLEATEEYLKEFPGEMPERRRTALAMMLAVDRGIGRIVEFLENENRLENTLFIFASDNGAPLGANQNAVMADVLPVGKAGPAWDGSRNDPLSGEKGMLAEGGIRVPMIMSWPARLPKGKVAKDPVLSLDLVSSILAAAGLDVSGEALDGINLLPYLTGQETLWPVRPIFWRFWSQSAIRLGDWKLIRVSDDIRMLFNLREDKEERHNLISTHPEKAMDLGRLLDAWTRELPPPESMKKNHQETLFYQYHFPETE